jgi:hypothetical protein
MDELFYPESLLPYVCGTLPYPTQDQIRLSRIIRLTQFYLYFSDMVLAEETRLQVGANLVLPDRDEMFILIQ